MSLGEKLYKLRIKHDKTQLQMAELVGVSQQTYQKYEKKRVRPNDEILVKLANYFNVTTDYLLGNEKNYEIANLDRNVTTIKVLGSVPAGVPIEAIEDIVDWEEIPVEWLKKGEYFALRLSGNSMFPNYLDGDTVIFKKQSDVDCGQNALVYVNGYDATFKKVIKKEDGRIILQPLNPEYTPMLVEDDETFTVVGIPIEIRRKENL